MLYHPGVSQLMTNMGTEVQLKLNNILENGGVRCRSDKGSGIPDVFLKMGVVHIHRQIWEGYTCWANGHAK